MARRKRQRYPVLVGLKGLIRQRGLSYQSIARKMCMGTSTFSNKINGFYAFNVDEMEQIATILEIAPKDIAYFFMPSRCETYRTSV